jgi:surface antigen
LIAQDALASTKSSRLTHHAHAIGHHVWAAGHHVYRFALHGRRGHRWRVALRGGGISCVPFARSDSGIALAGNAWQWWDHAAGVYARGEVPEEGSVLAFRSNPRMRLGHVAVVSRIINAREVEIDQANWWGAGMRGGVSHNVPVVDVSEANDWSAVRVGLGRSGDFGSVYPTYGFIYDRPDSGMAVATAAAPAPQPALNPVPRDLRPLAERPWPTFEEVAQAPAQAADNGAVRPVSAVQEVGAIDRK